MDWDKIAQLLNIIEKISTLMPGKYGNIVTAAHTALTEIHDDLAPEPAVPTPVAAAPITPAAPNAQRSDGMPSPSGMDKTLAADAVKRI